MEKSAEKNQVFVCGPCCQCHCLRAPMAWWISMAKSSMGRKGFTSSCNSQFFLVGSQGRSSKKKPKGFGTWRRGHGGMPAYWLILITWSLPSYKSQDHLPRDGTSHSELSPPILIINQENTLPIWQQAIWWRHFLSWGPLVPNLTPAYVKLTKTK